MLTTVFMVTASDDRYSMPLATMLKSVEVSLNPDSHVQVFVLNSGVTVSNKKRIEDPIDRERMTVNWIDMTDRKVIDVPLPFAHISMSTYSRLFMGELLPSTLGKVIYLDGDIVVASDITKLWHVDLKGRPAAAVRDAGHPWHFSSRGIDCKKLGCSPGDAYFNAGVIVVDLVAWRKGSSGESALSYIIDNREKIEFSDQDGLNATWAAQWHELGPVWNCQSELNLYPFASSSPYTSKDFLAARREPAIIHFSGPKKPWDPGCSHPFRSRFYDFLDMTSWGGWRPAEAETQSIPAADPDPEKLIVNLFSQSLQLRKHGLPVGKPLRGCIWLCLRHPMTAMRRLARRFLGKTNRKDP